MAYSPIGGGDAAKEFKRWAISSRYGPQYRSQEDTEPSGLQPALARLCSYKTAELEEGE